MSTPKSEETKPATPAATSSAFTWPAGTAPATSLPYQPYQPYSSHYPQAAYGHYQYPAPLAAQALQASLSRTTAPTNVDNTDVAALNDALGSAGVDLRVRFTLSALSSSSLLCRQRKSPYNAPTTSISPTGPMKTAHANRPSSPPSTPSILEPRCAPLPSPTK